jgi:hypothetical protein
MVLTFYSGEHYKENTSINRYIEVTFKSGKQVTYNHDVVYEIMKDKLETMNCFIKYKSYTSSTSIPVILRDKEIV